MHDSAISSYTNNSHPTALLQSAMVPRALLAKVDLRNCSALTSVQLLPRQAAEGPDQVRRGRGLKVEVGFRNSSGLMIKGTPPGPRPHTLQTW